MGPEQGCQGQGDATEHTGQAQASPTGNTVSISPEGCGATDGPAAHPTDPTESDTGDDLAVSKHSDNSLTESDAGGSCSDHSTEPVAGSGPRSASPPPGCRGPAKPGEFPSVHRDPIDQLVKVYDPECKAFAVEIYEAIRCEYPADSVDCRAELGNFAAAWSKAQTAGLPPSMLQGLWTKSVKEAKALGVKRRRVHFKKSPEAVWRYAFNRRLLARKAEAGGVAKQMKRKAL